MEKAPLVKPSRTKVKEILEQAEPQDCYAACQFAGNADCSRKGKLLCYADVDKLAKAICDQQQNDLREKIIETLRPILNRQ